MRVQCWIPAVLAMVLAGMSNLRAEQVAISEIMYHPPGTLPEYIELYNATATVFDVAEWQLTGGVDYTFPAFSDDDPGRTFLKPFERIVLCGVEEAALRAAYRIPPTVRIYGPWTGNLKNSGERITLNDKNGTLICSVEYGDRGHWPLAADGAGYALALQNPDREVDDWRNWAAGSHPGGTPGAAEVQVAETSVASPEVNLTAGGIFVDYGDVWRYNDQNVDLGTAWQSPTYDDSAWPQGPGLLGFEDATLPPPGIRTPFKNSRQLTYYARLKFTYTGSLKNVTLTIDQILDDGAVYYLNGQEIGRPGMPSGTITFTTPAGRTVSDAAVEARAIRTDGSALVKGTNVLAVEVHQVSTSSSDVVFGMRLNISAPVEPSLLINEVLPAGAGIGFVEFYNPGTAPINLRDHYLTDDPCNLQKFRIAEDVMVPAGGLAAVGFTESGLMPASPVKVYLVDVNGVTVINAISAAMALDGRSIGRKPTGGASWFLFSDPTRGTPNVSFSGSTVQLHLNEVHFRASKKVDWVELYNGGGDAIPLDGLFLASKADFSDKVPLSGSIPAGGYASQDVAFSLSGTEVTLFLIDSSGLVLSAQALERPLLGDTVQAYPDGSAEWYAGTQSTRGAANSPARNTSIVINEIMYSLPSDEPSGEFIELYNRGTAAVDVSGWQLAEGVTFTMPAGTIIPGDGYLVVAADANWIRATYGDVPVVGDFSGHLSNRGEVIRLVDQWGNLANQVDYRPGGNWPDVARGGGSSMELRHPWMDNRLPSAWSDSNEADKMPFEHYSYSDTYKELKVWGSPTDYKELHFYLVGDSHVVLKNIQVRLNGTGPNLIANGDKMSTDGRSANGWLAQGSHYASHLESGALHLISDGHGDNRPNRVEIDITAIQKGQKYEVSFDARWVSGTSRLIVETFDHSIGTSISLPVASDLGTPGARNSCYISDPAPQVDGLWHDPPVPGPGQAVRVTAHVVSPTPAPQVLLYYRLDNDTGSGVWASKAMVDDGTSGDAQAGDGIYTAQLSEYTKVGNIVQFYVRATLPNGQASLLPKGGAGRPAMYMVDDPLPAGDLRRMRFVMSALDLKDIREQDKSTAPYGYAFPRLSNHHFNATLIVNEKDILYGCGLRSSGSPWTRGTGIERAKFEFPRDNLFRGKQKLVYRTYSIDNPSWSHDRIVRYWLYLLGNPTNENEFIVVKVNNTATGVREEMEPTANDMLDRAYPDGSQGELYKIDDEWWFQDDWSRTYRDADWSYKGSDNADRYRSEWMKRTRENEDDYTALISFFKKVNSNYTQAEIERLVDPVASLKACAVAGYVWAWDFFSTTRGKNCSFYRRPTDGRFMFFPWDMKRSFETQNIGQVFYKGMPGFTPWLEMPYNMRLFKHYLTRLIENYTTNSARIAYWLQLEQSAGTQLERDTNTQYDFGSAAYKSWFTGRQNAANAFLGASKTMAFSLSGSRQGAAVGVQTCTLTGVAPLRVFRVEVVGHPEGRFSWTNEAAWSVSGLILHAGANELAVRGVDEFGGILHEVTITVNQAADASPVMALRADLPSWQVPLSRPLLLDASDSYDPEGTPLKYAWSATPAGASLDFDNQSASVATFARAGIYTIAVTGTDAANLSTTVERDVAVYGPNGLSDFERERLEPFWTLENMTLRRNYTTGPYYSLTEVPGSLVLQVWNDQAYPLAAATPTYPFLWRALPPETDWAFLATATLKGQIFSTYVTGLLVDVNEGGSPMRYVFGIENGTMVNVRRITAAGVKRLLESSDWNESQARLRIRRVGAEMFFDQEVNGTWTPIYSMVLPAGSGAVRAGMFVATDTAQSIKVAFDDAILVDPNGNL